MIKIIKKAPGNIAAFKAEGEVTKKDFETVFKRVQEVIDEEGELNYLLKLDTDVKNFTAGAWLHDMLLGVKHLDKWNRCAIVSDNALIDKVTAVMNKFTIGEFKVFPHEDYEEALRWTAHSKTGKKHSGGHVGAALAAGLGGAVALNILHETIRKTCANVPEVNEVGEEGLDKLLKKANVELNDDQLYGATLAADVLSNGIYYAALATNKAGVLSGILGGLGAVVLPKYLGLDDAPVAATDRKKVMTVAYYTFGAVVTGLLYNMIKKK